MVMECIKADGYRIDDITKSQMWDCENSAEILSECNYQVVATDMLAGAMTDYKDREDMLVDTLGMSMLYLPDIQYHYGIADGHMEPTVQWKCQYENVLIQPAREVLDICMNEYALVGREN